jgi:hypothetical protein
MTSSQLRLVNEFTPELLKWLAIMEKDIGKDPKVRRHEPFLSVQIHIGILVLLMIGVCAHSCGVCYDPPMLIP